MLELGENEKARQSFILSAINEHKASDTYRIAKDAEAYYRQENPTIMRYMKMIYNQLGRAIPDIYAANNKIPSNLYFYCVTQRILYLLGNGITFSDAKTKEKLGKDFDRKVMTCATYAVNGSAGFGFFNLDHIDVFSFTEFVPLYDEEDGTLKAGIRFWQLSDNSALRATLYELDGYTEYIKKNNTDDENIFEIFKNKTKYKLIVKKNKAEGERITGGENYNGFPIVPLYNIHKKPEIVGKKFEIDALDLMTSQLVNSIDDCNVIYWVLKNCEGMSPEDDAKFIEQLKLTHVVHANGDEGAGVDAHTIDVPFEASETAINMLEKRIYTDFMALDVRQLQSGSVTATQIQSAYEPLNSVTDLFEYCVADFINGILKIAGINDTPTFVRSKIINQTEEVNNILTAANYFDDEFIIKRLCNVLGCPDDAENIIKRRNGEESKNFFLDDEGDMEIVAEE